ncbi:MAG: hypothetical protein V1667_03760 [bacterium]
MLQYSPYLVFLGSAVYAAGTYSYIKDVMLGNAKPNKMSWLLWAIAPFIATAAAISDGVGLAVMPVFISGFGAFVIFIASFANKNAYWKLERLDYWCGFFSVLSLIFWGITKKPEVAIIFAIASDGFAGLPTLIKSLKYPKTENAGPFITGLFCSLISLAAVKNWNFSELAFVVYLLFLDGSITFAIYRGRILGKMI